MKRAAFLALCLCAAGCEEPAVPAAEQGDQAAGEVLAGSISDAMIPLDQLESQAPLAPRQAPAVNDIDAEQPDVVPVAGIEELGTAEEAGAADAAPTSEPDQ